jgi:formylglycine-generating enzyme required for sulfatase activity
MSIHFSRFFPALLLVGFLLSASAVGAQDTSSSGSVTPREAVSAEADSGDRKLPIESVSPYSYWKHHVALKPEEALVAIRYAEAGAGTKTLATGLVIRCDGFVLVPRGVRDTARNGGSVQITLNNVDIPKGTKSSSVTVTARNHPFTHATVPYALVKTTGYHVRSLPLLDSTNVSAGNSIRMLWFTAGENGDAPTLTSRTGVVGATTAVKDTFSITPVSGGNESIPFGAIVIDEVSGAAIGMVTQEGTHPAFITLARFNVISSEVGLAPDRAAVRLGDSSGTLPTGTGEMVWVPGGPVPLDGNVARDYTRDYGTTTACTPGVWMAVQPVTNGEYRQWLAGQMVRRLPFGWKPEEIQKTTRRKDSPACGMLVEDATFFAASRHTRLPTEVEWRRAAYCRDTSWAEEMNQDWDRAGQQIALLFERQQRHVAELMAMAEEATRQRIPPPGQAREIRTKGGSAMTIPAPSAPTVRSNSTSGILLAPTSELIEDGLSIQQFTNEFLSGQWRWGQVVPVDSFRQDESIFGVRNVLINAPEYVQGSIQQLLLAPKKYPSRVDPDLSQFHWGEMSTPKPDYLGVGGFRFWTTGLIDWLEETRVTSDDSAQLNSAEILRRMLLGSFMIRYWRGGEASWQGVVSIIGDVTTTTRTYDQGEPIQTLPTRNSLNYKTVSIRAGFRTDVRAGFRCAR